MTLEELLQEQKRLKQEVQEYDDLDAEGVDAWRMRGTIHAHDIQLYIAEQLARIANQLETIKRLTP